jgi:hypothetical protein
LVLRLSFFNRLTKLASLLVKTLAKPLSKRIKHDFSRFEISKRFLIGIGQTSHTITSRMQIWSAGYKVRSITPLESEAALKSGAEFVGESFIFLVSGGLVVWEYNRSNESARNKEAQKVAKQKAEYVALQAKLHTLDVRLKAVENVVKQNSDSILGLRSPKYIEPSSNELVSIDDDEDEDEKGSQQTNSTEATPRVAAQEERNTTTGKPWWKIW